jgi:hypothetical protein
MKLLFSHARCNEVSQKHLCSSNVIGMEKCFNTHILPGTVARGSCKLRYASTRIAQQFIKKCINVCVGRKYSLLCWQILCVQPIRTGATFLKFLAKIVTTCAIHYTMRCKGWIDSIHSLLTKLRDFYVHVTVHRNKFLFYKTN